MANDVSLRGIFGRLSGRVVNFLRSYGRREQEYRLQPKGVYGPDRSLFAAYGYNDLAEQMRLETDLQSRYVDYEDMDEYVETCLAGDSTVFTLEWGWKEIRWLAEQKEPFHVLSYDAARKSLVPARADGAAMTGVQGHEKPMVRVTLDSGQSIRCTADHLFMTRGGGWIAAAKLVPGQRLMPGDLRLLPLNSAGSQTYWQVCQPGQDADLKASRNNRWVWVHRLVGETMLGLKKNEVVHHHEEGGPWNNAPQNLEALDRAEHAKHHLGPIDNSRFFPEWTEERRRWASARMLGNTHHKGVKATEETRRKLSEAGRGRRLSPEHRQRIGDAHRIFLDPAKVIEAFRTGGTVVNTAKLLGVSWSTARRAVERTGLVGAGNNHRVLSVEPIPGGEPVYDLTVPGYHNFVCNGVVIHNSNALDAFADEATQPDPETGKTVWIEADVGDIKDKLRFLFERRLKIDEEIWSMTRSLVKYGNCVSRGTRVWGNPSVAEIQDMKPGDKVVAYEGHTAYSATPVIRRFDNGTKKVVRVRTKHREILATVDHRLLVEFPDGRRDWLPIQDFVVERYPSGQLKASKNTCVVICTKMPTGRERSFSELIGDARALPEWGNKGTPHQITLPDRVEPWFCRLFGFFLGDGWIAGTETTHTVAYARGKAHPDRNDYYDALIRRLGLPITVTETCTKAHSIQFERLLCALGWIDGAENKRVPKWVYGLPEEHREAFLQGFMDADGWESKPKTWNQSAFHFEIANEALARDLKTLIDGLGYRSGNLRMRQRKNIVILGKRVKKILPAYTLTFSKWKFAEPFVAERVLSVEPAGESEVYDLEVGSSAHNFVADGVVVHNCFEELITTDDGVMGLYHLPAPSVRRVEKDKGLLLGFIQSITGTSFSLSPQEFEAMLPDTNKRLGQSDALFEDWQVVHMRFQSRLRHAMYGYGVLEPARWVWKRLLLLEDSALIYRLTRAPSRYVFTVDVGQIPRNEVFGALNKYKDLFKKRRLVDPSTGKLTMRFNPLCLSGDTKVVLMDGREAAVRELAAEYAAGKKNWVYSVDETTKRVVPGEILWAGPTRQNAEMVEVDLDNGKSVRCTPDHKFLTRAGEYVEAQHLKVGESLMPLYRRRVRGNDQTYEQVMHPSDSRWEHAHRIMARSIYGDDEVSRPGRVVHHAAFDGLNNYPQHLALMTKEDHTRLHYDLGSRNIQKAIARVRELWKDPVWAAWRGGIGADILRRKVHGNPEVARRLAEGSSLRITAYNRSEGHRRRTAELNIARDAGRFIRAYNVGPKHEADNAIRAIGKRAMWADPERRAAAMGNMRIKFDDWSVSFVADVVRRAPKISVEKAAAFLRECEGFIAHLNEINARPIRAMNRQQLRVCLCRAGFADWEAFKKVVLAGGAPLASRVPTVDNHRVVEVRRLDTREDTYTLTISPVHNFALSVGVVVKNSMDEDFFLPKANGERLAEVETLEGPTYQVMDDVEYFRSKLFAAIKIPKAYMGYDESETKSTLAMQDVNFARVIMRIQREVRNGLKRAGNVHLVALGIDPAAVDWDVSMMIPSAIFELAQLEVRNARAEFAEKMEKWVSHYWIMRNIFGYSDEEVEAIAKQRAKEAEGEGAASEKESRKRPGGGGSERGMETRREPTQALFSGTRRIEPGAVFGANRRRRTVEPLTEEWLFKGRNKDHEKFVEDNFKKLMQRNRATESRLVEVRGMMRELSLSLKSSRKR